MAAVAPLVALSGRVVDLENVHIRKCGHAKCSSVEPRAQNDELAATIVDRNANLGIDGCHTQGNMVELSLAGGVCPCQSRPRE
jgi:hypothetical protein